MKKILGALFVISCLTGCVSAHNDVLGTKHSQVQMRNYQSRAFETEDKAMVLRAVISTMQDLDFIIERADEKLGTISGTSFSNASKLTVSVRVVDGMTVVRANAQAGLRAISDPIPYQNFFNALSQSLFLEAFEVQ